MSKYAYNPFTSNLDIAGSESYIDGVVATPASLPVTLNTPVLDSVYLAKAGSGVWLINRRPAGLYCRVANNGNLNDWVALGAFPEINADGNWELYNSADPTKELKFDLSGIATGTTRTITVPNKNLTLDDASDARTPTAHTHAASAITSGVFDNARINFAAPSSIGSTTANSGAFTTLTATPAAGATALTLTGGTVTASAPLIDATQTWNNAAVTFTGLRLNATNTASATASLLMDLQTGGTTQFSVRRDGVINANYYRFTGLNSGLFVHSAGGGVISIGDSPNNWMTLTSTRMQLTGDLSLGRALSLGQSADTILARDAANTLALINSTNPQTFRLYNTFTDANNYERAKIAWSSNVLQIGTEKGGTGSARALEFQTDGLTRLIISAGGSVLHGLSNGVIGWTSSTILRPVSGNGTLVLSNNAQTDFNRLQFGGTDATFPALKRSSTTLQVRLADDSAFAPLQASQFNGPSDANLTIAARGTTALTFDGNEMYMARQLNGQGNNLYNFATIGFGNASSIGDAVFARDAADTIAQRRGLNAQTYRIYNTVSGTNNVNFERANFRWASNEFIIDAEAGGTGTSLRGIKIGSATSSLLGFYGATPAAQPAAVADATDAATVITQLNALLSRLRTIGIIAT